MQTFFTHAVTIRDNLVPVEWRPKLQVLDYIPTWPWWVWALGVLTLTVVMVLVSASRWIMRLERALNDRALPGRNASEIAPWRERGRTLTNQWRHLLQHGAASEYQAAAQEADAWRQDMRQRLDRKYGAWIGTSFNETREVDSHGLPFLSHLAEPSVPLRVVAEVEIEEVADAEVVVREARLRARDRAVRVGVARDEDVGPAVAVDVGDRGARVPAVGGDPGCPRAPPTRPAGRSSCRDSPIVRPGVVLREGPSSGRVAVDLTQLGRRIRGSQ